MKRCKASGKIKFQTKADALVKALRVSHSDVGAGSGGAYRCIHCGSWHLTRRPRGA